MCPYNRKFSAAATEPAFAPIEKLAASNARTLARELLALSPDDFATAYKLTPLSRAKLAGLQRNAAAVLGNVSTGDDG